MGSAAMTVRSPDPSEGYEYLIVLWYTLHVVGGHFLLPVLIATFAFTKIKRHATLVNLCIIFVLTSIASCLLLYTRSFVGPPPNRAVCFFQAAGTDSFPPAWATALLALCLQIWSNGCVEKSKWAGMWKAMMVITPYVAYIVFFIAAAMIGAFDPDLVVRSPRHIYCQVQNNTLGVVSGAYSAAVIVISIGLTVHSCIRLWQSYQYLKSRKVPCTAGGDVSLLLRLSVFVLYSTVGLIFSLWTAISQPNPGVRDIYIATLSPVIFFAFGTQQDVLRVWCFWRPRSQEETVISVERQVSSGQPPWITAHNAAFPGSPAPIVIGFDQENVSKALPSLPTGEGVMEKNLDIF